MIPVVTLSTINGWPRAILYQWFLIFTCLLKVLFLNYVLSFRSPLLKYKWNSIKLNCKMIWILRSNKRFNISNVMICSDMGWCNNVKITHYHNLCPPKCILRFLCSKIGFVWIDTWNWIYNYATKMHKWMVLNPFDMHIFWRNICT